MNKILKISFVLFSLILIWCHTADAKLNLFPQPRYVPDLSFYGDSGKRYKLKNFSDDLLIAMIWSRRCGPCLADLKPLNEFVLATAGSGIRVILISPDNEWKSVDEKRAFLKRFGAPDLVSYMDRKASFMNGMGIMVTPTALLINRDGLEVGQVTGAVQWNNPKVIDYMLRLKNRL